MEIKISTYLSPDDNNNNNNTNKIKLVDITAVPIYYCVFISALVRVLIV